MNEMNELINSSEVPVILKSVMDNVKSYQEGNINAKGIIGLLLSKLSRPNSDSTVKMFAGYLLEKFYKGVSKGKIAGFGHRTEDGRLNPVLQPIDARINALKTEVDTYYLQTDNPVFQGNTHDFDYFYMEPVENPLGNEVLKFTTKFVCIRTQEDKNKLPNTVLEPFVVIDPQKTEIKRYGVWMSSKGIAFDESKIRK